jgi:hypothetical protein
MVITGTGNLTGLLKFAATPATASTLQNLTINRITNGLITLGSDLTIEKIYKPTAGVLSIGSDTLSLNGTIDATAVNTGTLTGSSSSNLTIGGTTGGSLGTLNFTGGTGVLNLLTMNRTNVGANAAAVLGSSLSVSSLNLFNGILATGNNLFTWNNAGGSLTAPPAQSLNYGDSYICLCNSTGDTPVSFTKPFDGTLGFKIKNVSTNTFFPVGVDFISPNRMWINNTGDPDDLTVVMEKGDIGNTDKPRVNRLWYARQSDSANKKMSADMKLYFTKRDWTPGFPSPQDERNRFPLDRYTSCSKRL